MKKLRLFIALPLPGKTKQSFSQTQISLKKLGLQAKWVEPKNAHLTLSFLGSTNPNRIKSINQILETACRSFGSVKLHFSKTGCFPQPTKAKVIFIDLGGELDKLRALALKIQKGLGKEKIYFDPKPFATHLTLGRLKKPKNLTDIIEKTKLNQIDFILNKVNLVKSQLTPIGPVYTPLKIFKLRKSSKGNEMFS